MARAAVLRGLVDRDAWCSGRHRVAGAFLSNIVTPGGPTVGQWLIPQIEEGYKIGKMPTQLLLTAD